MWYKIVKKTGDISADLDALIFVSGNRVISTSVPVLTDSVVGRVWAELREQLESNGCVITIDDIGLTE